MGSIFQPVISESDYKRKRHYMQIKLRMKRPELYGVLANDYS